MRTHKGHSLLRITIRITSNGCNKPETTQRKQTFLNGGLSNMKTILLLIALALMLPGFIFLAYKFLVALWTILAILSLTPYGWIGISFLTGVFILIALTFLTTNNENWI
jgi:hypothetical protein